ncbi:M24 family metallopeptidase [Simiduia agarivorans]|uniref:Twin-arginine translocation pathway signal protein n=1 Tax=Simiduia agarivorans (strain DSM 21679 / JCM 13881 / BCRC 17597 / SA1) TaxID=1117647 RepID=K4KWW5_SIMAS|nr:Xaa-Pro peptidase family protein [Simiduia agarivorans]AFU98437.1 twin-arginine translocation pathway signal protein [Simiduia agarivorans SA1 = DSM 21679]
MITKRQLLKGSALMAAATLATPGRSADATVTPALTPITGDIDPISVREREARVARAQALMNWHKIDAILLEPGPAMLYFTGIKWWRSERLTCVVIPRKGEIGVITPFFEEPSVRESMTFGDDVRTWHEHESPFKRVAQLLADRDIKAGKLGLEASVRWFVADGLRAAAPKMKLVSADPITRGCRMIKSPTEIALMKKANEITLRAYGEVYRQLQAGMTPADVNTLMRNAQTALGGSGVWTMALFGEASAYPHGTDQPQEIKPGQIVLMDCGCAVEGYQSDISRTFVFGEPNAEQTRIWNLVRQGQNVAFEAAKIGVPAGKVDDAVRAFYQKEGFGPDYQLPGLSHRTGHGIGMEGHEPVNFVRGETTPLAPGMCFSNEPGIYLPGDFGVRLEDCIYMTEQGPQWFTRPPENVNNPLGSLA